MNIKEQVLSIAQVQELQELGFDINKYASMCWIYDRLFSTEDETTKAMICQIKSIPTMTIGDMADILPIEIDEYVLDMNRIYVSYDSKRNNLFYAYKHKFIDNLFDCLVWCIKEKHIEL